MYSNRKSELFGKGILIGGAATAFVSLIMMILVPFSRAGVGEMITRLLGEASICAGAGVFAFIGWYGIRPRTKKYFAAGIGAFTLGMIFRGISVLIALNVPFDSVALYCMFGLAFSIISCIFLGYMIWDSLNSFFNQENDRIICCAVEVGELILGIILFTAVGKENSTIGIFESILMFLVGIAKPALPFVFLFGVDRITDPFTAEEEAEWLRKEAIRKEEARKLAEEKRKAKEAEREAKAAEKAAKAAEQKAKAAVQAAKTAEPKVKAAGQTAKVAGQTAKPATQTVKPAVRTAKAAGKVQTAGVTAKKTELKENNLPKEEKKTEPVSELPKDTTGTENASKKTENPELPEDFKEAARLAAIEEAEKDYAEFLKEFFPNGMNAS